MDGNRWRAAIVGTLIWVAALPAHAAEFRGKVVGIADGDTITVLRGGKTKVTVRLTEVDAPEGGQAWGQRSKQALGALVFGKSVRVVGQGRDRYGRTLGRVYVGSVDVSAELAKSGAAWAFVRYLTDAKILVLQTQAKESRRGLWSMPASQIIPPWDYRAGVRVGGGEIIFNSNSATQRTPANPSGAKSTLFTDAQRDAHGVDACGIKRFCTEMSSCAEARYYLHQCGVAGLDGDRDGVPCEKLC
jgi:endonuclease YncB( thermonuclease family)